MKIGAVVLAAGGSTRLGSPKQLLEFRGQSLLRHAAQTVLATGCRPVIVVLGADAGRLRGEVADLDVRTVDNPDWGRGMGTSIGRGMEALTGLAPESDGVLLTLCDQPLVQAEMLTVLVRTFAENRGTCRGVAATYDGTRGVPAVCGREMFADLRALTAEIGARALLARPGGEILGVAMPAAAMDIDTREQYEALGGLG